MRRKREYSDFVRDMLVYAEKAERFVADMDLASFQADERTNMAVTRALEGSARRRATSHLRSADAIPTCPGERSSACAT
ncbi:MAG TPA: hypothetical protein VJO15_05230 [Dehalococcoidia bacterium]|nr:hypothetical protein [Dehalococcoidia bacterium]